MKDTRLVYSTNSGRICPECGRPVSACACGKKKTAGTDKAARRVSADGTIRIQREVRGRKGKTITAVYGVPLPEPELQAFAGILKRRCGTGGTVKEGAILIQGDHREALLEEIRKHGYAAKIAGG